MSLFLSSPTLGGEGPSQDQNRPHTSFVELLLLFSAHERTLSWLPYIIVELLTCLSWSCFGFSVWHVGSLFSDQESKPHPLHWKYRVLTTGLPGKAYKALSCYSFLCPCNSPVKWNHPKQRQQLCETFAGLWTAGRAFMLLGGADTRAVTSVPGSGLLLPTQVCETRTPWNVAMLQM